MAIERERQIQREITKQHANDIWDRTLFGMEILEFHLGEINEFPNWYDIGRILGQLPAGKERDTAIEEFKSGDTADIDCYVQIQARALARCIFNKEINIIDDMLWMAEDYLEWLGGRKQTEWSRVDEYSRAILKCIDGLSYDELKEILPPMLEKIPSAITKEQLMKAIQAFGMAQHLVDKVEEKVKKRMENRDDIQAETLKHTRGDINDGIQRIWENWQNPQDRLWLKNILLPKLGIQFTEPAKQKEKKKKKRKPSKNESQGLPGDESQVKSSGEESGESGYRVVHKDETGKKDDTGQVTGEEDEKKFMTKHKDELEPKSQQEQEDSEEEKGHLESK
jgi:hypothetical protein